MERQFAKYTLDVLREIKLFHWFTKNYEEHLISNELYNDLSLEIDAIVEGVLSKKKPHIPSGIPKVKSDQMYNTLLAFETYLRKFKEPRVQANIDNALQIIGKFLYLNEMAR